MAVPVVDNGELLINLETVQELTTSPSLSRSHVRSYWLRETVVTKLVTAQKALPDGLEFVVAEGYRSFAEQQRIFNGYQEQLRLNHSDWSISYLYGETIKYVADPSLDPPHTTGGAVDITFARKGKLLDMGTALDATPEESQCRCYTSAEDISLTAKQNRHLLIAALSQAGLVNFPYEWWHWSYGDRVWAIHTGAPAAIYGSVAATMKA